MSKKGVLTVISGFSGAGKGTIVKKLLADHEYYLSVSCTTRAPREGEVDGKDYFFLSREEFEKKIRDKEMIEYAEYAGNYYGTPKKAVEDMLTEGKDVILEIEVQGGMQVKKLFPDAVLMFVIPPSAKELYDRLKNRGTESDEQIGIRFEQTVRETHFIKDYDYLIINDDLNKAVDEIIEIIDCQHYRTDRQSDAIDSLAKELAELVKEKFS